MDAGYPGPPACTEQGIGRRRVVAAGAAVLVAPGLGSLLAGCTAGRSGPPAPVEDAAGRMRPTPGGTGAGASGGEGSTGRTDAGGSTGRESTRDDEGGPGGPAIGHRVERAGSTWVRVAWSELPGFAQEPSGPALAAWLQSCSRAGPAWAAACRAAASVDAGQEAAVQSWMRTHLRPWRIEDRNGRTDGLLTGYYEPHFEARRQPDAEFRAPLHAPPADLNQRRPYWTRRQLESLPQAQASLRGRALAYLRDPLDVLVLQIQGSGRLTLTEPDGRRRAVRMAYAAHNDHPYGSVGRWLIDQGHLTLAQASWPGIRDWLQRNPSRAQEVLWVNPRVVFFREEPLVDPHVGPRGAMGVPLTPGRSIAVDPRSIPYGSPVWMDSSDTPGITISSGVSALRRLVVAQDTGSAITGAVRADYFWGWGDEAEQQAGRTRQRLRLWVLWPVGHPPPA